MLCKENASKAPALQSDSVLRGLTDDNTVGVVIQNSLETNRFLFYNVSQSLMLEVIHKNIGHLAYRNNKIKKDVDMTPCQKLLIQEGPAR